MLWAARGGTCRALHGGLAILRGGHKRWQGAEQPVLLLTDGHATHRAQVSAAACCMLLAVPMPCCCCTSCGCAALLLLLTLLLMQYAMACCTSSQGHHYGCRMRDDGVPGRQHSQLMQAEAGNLLHGCYHGPQECHGHFLKGVEWNVCFIASASGFVLRPRTTERRWHARHGPDMNLLGGMLE
jgi:hypothetical protein